MHRIAPALLLALSLLPAVAQAQSRPAEPPPAAWRVECTGDGKMLDCRAMQQMVQRENQQVVASVAVRIAPDTKKPNAVVQVPLGIAVADPIMLQVDEGASERYGIQTCTQNGCFGGGVVPDPLIAAMRSGRQLKIVFQNLNKQPLTVTMPLAGFALAYDKIK